jgi:hypothetical protein
MRAKKSILILVLAAASLVIFGCGKKADENKPMAEVKAEAEKMNVEQLKSMAMSYKSAIEAKTKDIDALATKLKEIPVANMLGEEAKKIKADIDEVTKSLEALKERFDVYYNALKEKGIDVSNLQL